jgi:CHAT domain-containing protein
LQFFLFKSIGHDKAPSTPHICKMAPMPPSIIIGDPGKSLYEYNLPLSADSNLSFEDEVRQVSNEVASPEDDDETNIQDSDFQLTSVSDVYECARDENESQDLARYLPAKIVLESRNKYRDCVRLGCDQDGFAALADGVELLKTKGKESSDAWRFSAAELLLDLGDFDEASKTLAQCTTPNYGPRTLSSKPLARSTTPSHGTRTLSSKTLARSATPNYGTRTLSSTIQTNKRRRTDLDSDAEFEEMERLAGQKNLQLLLRAEEWEKAREMADKLEGIDPEYFNIDKPMDRFSKCKQFLTVGILAETRGPEKDIRQMQKNMAEALKLYNKGCFATELFHKHFDHPESRVYGFDHVDCANLFFSAARVCIYFDKHGFSYRRGNLIKPTQFKCRPKLTEEDWRHQALHFLEQGRSRALLESIVRGEKFVTPMQRRLLLDDVAFAVKESIRFNRSNSLLTPPSHSRASSMSSVASPRDSTRNSGTLSSPVDATSNQLLRDMFVQQLAERTQGFRPSRPFLNTSNLDENVLVETPEYSPLSSIGSHQSLDVNEQRMTSLRVRMRWRRALLYAFAINSNPALEAALPRTDRVQEVHNMRASIPPDTVVIEYALASATPTGLMTIVCTADGIDEALWDGINAVAVKKQIADLRGSMRSLNARYRDFAQSPKSPSSLTLQDVTSLQQSLKDLLVKPIQKHLEGKKSLIIIPSGDLALVPWTMLFHVPVTVVPSFSIWMWLHAHRNEPANVPPKVSIISNAPRTANGALREDGIPYSRLEAFHIAQEHHQEPFLADNHDRAAFDKLVKSTQVLHLCAHSSFDEVYPMASSIQLFKEPLTILDWHNLAIKADLVVFSSCLSGISRTYDSGSTFGFAHTLLATGTRAFIGSLWEVEDRPTLLLMMLFYEELRRPLSPAKALHNAQMRMRKFSEDDLEELQIRLRETVASKQNVGEYVHDATFYIKMLGMVDVKELRHPRCWAAFVLTGYGFTPLY